ncbi:MAG: large subunit ribosomal protein L31e [Parcubacteria group bacterium Gr01-1014_107]|nr:MAG: large subunit ribosomal protein L31e [Parcubacteria group bacterium Gr01-1014_107]
MRKAWRKAPIYKRSKRAVSAVRAFLTRHMKAEEVKIGKELNEKIFSRGYKKPPHKIQITAVKDGNIVRANLVGFAYKDVKEEPNLKELEKPKKEELIEKIEKEIKKEDKDEEDKKEVKGKT